MYQLGAGLLRVVTRRDLETTKAAVLVTARWTSRVNIGIEAMKMLTVTTLVAGVLVAAAVGSAGTAAAVPTNGSADVVVKALQDQGYNVQFNEPSNMQLSRCTVNGVHGVPVMMAADGNLMVMMQDNHFDTVVVDLNCPSSNN